MTNHKTFRIFFEDDLGNYLNRISTSIRNRITSELEEYILNVNEADYIAHLTDSNRINNLIIDFESNYVTYDRIGEYSPRYGTHRPALVINYHIPFTGDPKLLELTPSSIVARTYRVSIEEGCICLRITLYHEDPERVKKEYDNTAGTIRENAERLNKELNTYNEKLPLKIRDFFRNRKNRILKDREIMSALDVPIRRRQDLPNTFSVPTPRIPKKIIPKPKVTEKRFIPEPTLDIETYKEILRIIHDVGKEFERHPATYSDKDEETLRDHFLLYLQPRFEGSATGETFNNKGKTDILMRYENSNVFVAECKFWKGQKEYLKAIDQLLSYLTWRDSKAALILFVTRKDFSNVIKTIEQKTPDHPCYLAFVDKDDESWFNYHVHILGDRSREVKLAVLAYHIPSSES